MLPPISTAMSVHPHSAGASYRPPSSFPLPTLPGRSVGLARRPSVPAGLSGDPLALREPVEDDHLTPLTLACKRRRRNTPLGPPTTFDLSRRSSLVGRMDPPPFPTSAGSSGVMVGLSHPRSSSYDHNAAPDPSLTLPPLQTTTTTTTTTPEARSIEAMVMTIPYINKMKVLAKISPRLRPPGPTSPAQEVRGVVIAVDGTNKEVIGQVSSWLVDELSRDSTMAVRTFEAPVDWEGPSRPSEVQSPVQGASSACFLAYLESVAAWHRRSEEVIRYITTSPSQARETSSTTTTTTTKGTESDSLSQPSTIGTGTSTSTTIMTTPIAIIPAYMLTRSNLAAVHIPINDAYAPSDHWQWAATLWRGIVGPDLNIWVQEDDHRGGDHLGRSSRSNGGGGGGIEVREDARALIVGIDAGRHELEGRVLRRLTFEVGEFIRSMGMVEGGVGS